MTPMRAMGKVSLATEAPGIGPTFDQQRAREYIQQTGGYDWTWHPGAKKQKATAKGETTQEMAANALALSPHDESSKLIRYAENLQRIISGIDTALADDKTTDRDKLQADRAVALRGLRHVVDALKAKADLPVTSGDIQRAKDWQATWIVSYPAVSGYEGPVRPKATAGSDEFKVNAGSSIGELLRAEAGLYGLYHREPNAGVRADLKDRIAQVESWIRLKQASGDAMEAARARDWVAGYRPKIWTFGPAAETPAKKAGTEIEIVRRAIEELNGDSAVGRMIRSHDMAFFLLRSLQEAKGPAGDINELKGLMSRVKRLMNAKAGVDATFERERAREWLTTYAATYEASPRATRPAAAVGSLEELAAVDGASSFGTLVRTLVGLNGLYHRLLTDADELEGKGERERAAALRNEASRARQAFGRVEGLVRGKASSADAMERARAHEWFRSPDGFSWEHAKVAGVGKKPSLAETPVTNADPTGKLIARYEALYGVFKGEEAAFAVDGKDEHRVKAERSKSEAARVLALISARR